MKNISLIAIASLMFISSYVYAEQSELSAPINPASKEWVLQQLAKISTKLTAEDWAAACDSGGSPTSITGCYGNIASPTFAKINRIVGAGGFTDQVDIPVISTPSSIFIQQFNGNSAIPSTASQSPQLKIPGFSPSAMCAYFSTAGANLSYTGLVLNDSCEVGGGIEHITNNNSFQTVYDRADECTSSVKVVVTYYLLCVGYQIVSNSPQPASLTGLVAR